MKKFMLFIHEDQNLNTTLSPEKMGALVKAHMDWSEELVQSGHLIAGDGIHPEGVRIVGKEGQVEEGAILNQGLIIGGFYILQAKNLTEALELAKGCPSHHWGGITEVRQIMSEEDYSG